MFFATENKRIKNMNDIKDIFTESNELGTEYFISSENGGYNLNGRPFLEDTATSRISTLSELFTEWYLFDFSHEKDIQTFLNEEQIDDVFTESEFIDLMCGDAFIDDNLIQFVAMKTPFRLTLNKLHAMNQSVSNTNNSAYIIYGKSNIKDKLCELFQLKKPNHKRHHTPDPEHRRKIKHEYYLRNKEYIQKLKHEHYLKNQERIKQRSKEYYAANKDRVKAHFAATKEHRKKIIHEIYMRNHEFYKARNKAYREAHREEQNQYSKEYYIAHREEQKQYQKEYYAKSQKNKAIAKNICAAYLFLLKFKKENKAEYLKLYKKYHDPLHNMFKTCIALQNDDIQLCPFCNENCTQKPEQCCNQKILSIPNAIIEIQSLANTLKQR